MGTGTISPLTSASTTLTRTGPRESSADAWQVEEDPFISALNRMDEARRGGETRAQECVKMSILSRVTNRFRLTS
jgi:hypothetical protein